MELRGIKVRELTARKFLDWEYFAEIEPFTFDVQLRDDLRIASIVQMIANVNRGKGQRAYTLEDFVLKFDEAKPKKPKTWQEMQKMAIMIAMAYNAEGVTS